MILSTLNLILQLAILIISLFFVIKSSDYVSNAAVKISQMTKLGEMAVGFLLLSIITSLPELSVAISSISSGDEGLSIGGLVGSNIANIGLILGLTAIIIPSTLYLKHEFRRLSLMIFLSSLPLLLILFFSEYNHFVGLFLLCIFIFFCIYSIKSNIKSDIEKKPTSKNGILKELLIVFAGICIIMISSYFVVDSAVYISKYFSISDAVLGSTIIAVGTSLPELSISITAAKKNHMDLALGNILGSCIVNLSLILGLVLVLSTVTINLTLLSELIIILIIANFALWRMVIDGKISMFNGLILIILFLIFLASTLGMQIIIFSSEYLIPISYLIGEYSILLFSYILVGLFALLLGWTLKK